jgi:hypothetical protein
VYAVSRRRLPTTYARPLPSLDPRTKNPRFRSASKPKLIRSIRRSHSSGRVLSLDRRNDDFELSLDFEIEAGLASLDFHVAEFR